MALNDEPSAETRSHKWQREREWLWGGPMGEVGKIECLCCAASIAGCVEFSR
jgi:hypothetical protein